MYTKHISRGDGSLDNCVLIQESADVLSKEYPTEKLKEISDKILDIQTAVMKLWINVNKVDRKKRKIIQP